MAVDVTVVVSDVVRDVVCDDVTEVVTDVVTLVEGVVESHLSYVAGQSYVPITNDAHRLVAKFLQ